MAQLTSDVVVIFSRLFLWQQTAMEKSKGKKASQNEDQKKAELLIR